MDAKDDRRPPIPGGIPKRKPVPKASKAPVLATWDTIPHTFLALTVLAAATSSWPLRWILSGAPIFFYCLLLGDSHGHRILPSIPLWTIFASINLAYAIASTSWLLYWLYLVLCYPCIIVCCLYQFHYAARFARSAFRRFLRNLHFFNDKVAFFNLPAMEFDTDVHGLLVIRGATLCLSTLTLVAHGVEVGIKLSEDMELAIQVDKVTVSLFRRIEVDDLYANIKGGEWEMTFGTLPPHGVEHPVETMIVSDTSILRAAANAVEVAEPVPVVSRRKTGDKKPTESSDPHELFESVAKISPDEDTANQQYEELLRHISQTSTIYTTTKALKEAVKEAENAAEESDAKSEKSVKSGKSVTSGDRDREKRTNLNVENINDLRAAIASQIHHQPSITHPPSKSIRLSTIKHSSSPRTKLFIRRFPLLYRLLLNPITYLHPVTFNSITAAGSGKWFKLLMQQYFFKHYATQDPEIRRLESRISTWLSDANFAVELVDIKANAQFPVNTNFDIDCNFKIKDVMAYRTLPGAVDLTQVVRIGGADATLSVPIYLFPHHEHIFPPRPTEDDEQALLHKMDEMKDTPQAVQTQTQLDQLRKDEANIKISAHAHLPARFHQDLLNFIAALVKATKVIESDKDFEEIKLLREMRRGSLSSNVPPSILSGTDSDASSIASDSVIDPPPEPGANKGFKTFLKKMDSGFKEAGLNMRDGMRKAGLNTASAMANDRWIAKLVGKLIQKLERAQGDVGYSGNIPVQLEKYRAKFESAGKILP